LWAWLAPAFAPLAFGSLRASLAASLAVSSDTASLARLASRPNPRAGLGPDF
jgi:hypothetical protein